MPDIMTHLQIIQVTITAAAGTLGVGVGLGIFKNDIRQIKKDLKNVKDRQARLRGEDNSGVPRYVSLSTCREMRTHCNEDRKAKTDCLLDELDTHSVSIKALNNFARWWMQKEGLSIQEINDILKG